MNEYVEDLMLRIAEKNMIIKSMKDGRSVKLGTSHRITDELDSLLYEFYKSLILVDYDTDSENL